MSSNKTDGSIYAAAQGREFLRNALEDKPNRWILEYAGLIDDPEVLDLLNYLCGLWEEHQGESFLESRLGELIVRNAATRMYDRAYREGNVSQLQGAVGLVRNTGEGEDALMKMARDLTLEGFVALVVGSPGAGKTAMALDVARVWKALTGGHVVTNVTSWTGADAYAISSKELREKMGELEGSVLALIDEGSQSLTSRGAEATQANRFAKDLKYIRKHGDGTHARQGSAMIIGHTENDVGKDIRRVSSAMWVKPSRAEPGRVIIKSSEGGRDVWEEEGEFTGLTDTSEEYDHREESEFSVVLEEDSESEELPSPEEIERKKDVEKALELVLLDGWSYIDAADRVPFSSSWVGDRVKEWRKGEYRDLVSPEELEEDMKEKHLENGRSA